MGTIVLIMKVIFKHMLCVLGWHPQRQINIAPKSEAASLYFMYLPVEKDSENSTYGVFKSGSKFMVVDAGGNVMFSLCYAFLQFKVN